MELAQLEIQESEQIEELFESSAIKFNKLKHNYFKNYLKQNENYLDFLKIGSRHYAFQLPENIDEIFVRKENTSFYWLLESPILTYCEKLLYENQNGSKNFDKTEIKKNFTKWVIASDANQKKIFASITLKACKNSSFPLTFLELIYHALVLILDESVRNPNKGLEELEKANQSINETVVNIELKKELNYLVQLYKGFALITLNDFEEALKEFSFAIDNKPHGITAKFYFAILSAKQNREDFTRALIKEVLEYDLEKLNYAIDNSSIVLLNFFLHNPIFPNIFYYYEFSDYSEYIQNDLIENNLDTKKITANLYSRLNQLKKCEFDEYYTEETKRSIQFLYDVSEQHSQNQSIFLSVAAEYLNEKFHKILDDILIKIKEKLYENYNRVMTLYQNTVDESEKLTEQYSKEVEDIKSSMQKKLATQIQQIEEYVKDALWEVEENKKNLNYLGTYDPAVSFRNSMSYNVVVSIIVFIIGGIAGYFNNSNYFENDFYLMLGRIILTGVKWSSLTFVIGFFISAFISGLVVFDKSNEKQKLEKRTLELQKQKELSIDMLKKEADQKQKALSEGYLERIDSHKRKIEDIKREKERQEPLLKSTAEEQLAPFKEKLNPIYQK